MKHIKPWDEANKIIMEIIAFGNDSSTGLPIIDLERSQKCRGRGDILHYVIEQCNSHARLKFQDPVEGKNYVIVGGGSKFKVGGGGGGGGPLVLFESGGGGNIKT